MEGESNGMEGGQSQCRAGCGFFGSSATDGLCSVCYKEVLKKKQQPPASSLKIPSPQRITPPSETVVATTSPQPPTPTTTLEPPLPTVITPQGDAKMLEELMPTSAAAGAAMDDTESHESATSTPGSEKKKSNRCQMCRKKVGLTGFECRCGGLYCSLHRYSDKHECTFDYRQLGAEEIRKNNPVVVGEKIHKI